MLSLSPLISVLIYIVIFDLYTQYSVIRTKKKKELIKKVEILSKKQSEFHMI